MCLEPDVTPNIRSKANTVNNKILGSDQGRDTRSPIRSGVDTGGGQGWGAIAPPWLWKMENSEICHLGENDTQLQCGFGF